MQTIKSPPTATRPTVPARPRTWVWLLVVLVVGLIVAGVVWLLADGDTVEPTTNLAPQDSPLARADWQESVRDSEPAAPDPPASKTPMPSFEALIGALYASVDERDTDANYALRTPAAVHSVYYSASGDLSLIATFTPTTRLDLATDPLRSITRLGPPLFSGMIVAVPAEFEYSTETDIGFDLFRIEEVEGGYLLAEQATFYAKTPVDPEVERFLAEDAAGLLTAYATAWSEGDEVVSRAAFAADGAFWGSWNEPGREVYEGDELTEFITSSVWFDVTAPSEKAVVAGPFLVVPNHLTAADTADGMSLFMFEDGKIALEVFQQ